jgi:cytochrome c oxidase subunit IV
METASAESVKKHVRVYVTVFVALMGLTLITVAISTLHLETHVAIIVALCIAGLKASLVAAYFMHLITEKKLIYAALALTVVLFVVLMVLPVSHFADRGL